MRSSFPRPDVDDAEVSGQGGVTDLKALDQALDDGGRTAGPTPLTTLLVK